MAKPTIIPPEAEPTHEQHVMDEVLLQVERAVGALAGAAHQVTISGVPRQAIPFLFERIDFNARRAEDAMRLLRNVELAPSQPATELSQSLTVVVLVADMVVSGHLSPMALGDADLFQRNLERAQQSIGQLREEQRQPA